MAKIPFDPLPFIPNGFNILPIASKNCVARVVLPHRQKHHEDWAISTIEPLPGQVLFPNVQEVLDGFLRMFSKFRSEKFNAILWGRLMCALSILETEID